MASQRSQQQTRADWIHAGSLAACASVPTCTLSGSSSRPAVSAAETEKTEPALGDRSPSGECASSQLRLAGLPAPLGRGVGLGVVLKTDGNGGFAPAATGVACMGERMQVKRVSICPVSWS